MDTSSFIVYIKTDDNYKIWQKTLKQDFTLQITVIKRENKKVIGLMKHELGKKIMTKLVELRAKTYSY